MMDKQSKLFSNTLPVKTTQSFLQFPTGDVCERKKCKSLSSHRHLGGAAASCNGEQELLLWKIQCTPNPSER